MTVQIAINNLESRIIGYLPDNIHQEISDTLSYKLAGIEYSEKVKSHVWDGVTRLYKEKRGQSFLTGLLSLVIDVLKKNKVPFTVADSRVKPEQNLLHLKFSPPPNYEEREYQQFAIERALARTRGIFKMATGSGKTMTVAETIGRVKTGPFMFYVTSKDLLEQAHDVLSSTLNEPIGKIGGGFFDIKMINVATIQTAIKAINLDNVKFKISDYSFDEEDAEIWRSEEVDSIEKMSNIRKVIQASKGAYVDEAHHSSSASIRDVVTASPNCFWKFGGSATPYREDNADLMIQALFGRKIVDINASYLIEKGYLCEPTIIFDHVTHNNVYHGYKTIYKNCIVEDPDFNGHVANTAQFLISQGLTTLILVQQYKHGELLKSLLPNIPFITGKTPNAQRQGAINDLRNKKIPCMIATTLADEGLDIPTLDAALLAGGGASATRVNQRIGRTLRIDRKSPNPRRKSLVIYYRHKAKYLEDHARKAKRIMKEEPKFNIVESKSRLHLNGEIEKALDLKPTQATLFD